MENQERGIDKMWRLIGAPHHRIDGLAGYNFDDQDNKLVLEFSDNQKLEAFSLQLDATIPESEGMTLIRNYHKRGELALRVVEPE